jgi:hypothetical protein
MQSVTESEFDLFKRLSNPNRIDLNKTSVVSRALEREIESPTQAQKSEVPICEIPIFEVQVPEVPTHVGPAVSVKSCATSEHDDTMDRQAMLVELNMLKMDGIILSRHFTINDSLEDMTFEINRIRSNTMASEAAAVGTTGLQMAMMMAEAANKRWGPILHLDGWANTVSTNQRSYNLVFARLYRKHWRQGGQISPELQLAGMLAASAFMTHAGQSFDFDSLKNMMPNQPTQPQTGAFTKRPSMRKPSPMPAPPAPAPDTSEADELRKEVAALRSQLHKHVASPIAGF